MIEGGLVYQGILFVMVFVALVAIVIGVGKVLGKEGKRDGDH